MYVIWFRFYILLSDEQIVNLNQIEVAKLPFRTLKV